MIRIRKLTLEQREQARMLRALKVPTKVVASEFGVSPQCIEYHTLPNTRRLRQERARRAA